jgi:hypothetical protein
MKVLGVTLEDKKTLICDDKTMLLQETDLHTYDVPLSIKITLKNSKPELKKGNKYYLFIFNIKQPVMLYLYEINKKVIAENVYNEYIFIHKEFYILLTNQVVPTSTEILGIKFKQVSLQGETQFAYFMNSLRKKGMFLSLDENLKLKGMFVNNAFMIKGKKVDVGNRFLLKDIRNNSNYKKNYYTILPNGKYASTKNGLGNFYYLPFATENDIKGLDVYLFPLLQIETNNTETMLGDTISFNNETYVISSMKFLYTTVTKKVIITLSKNVKTIKKDKRVI